jgi:hypothetical protein
MDPTVFAVLLDQDFGHQLALLAERTAQWCPRAGCEDFSEIVGASAEKFWSRLWLSIVAPLPQNQSVRPSPQIRFAPAQP